ncbi:MAG: DUF2282 domain-containing protein [Candidatus Berkiellales bacterium]
MTPKQHRILNASVIAVAASMSLYVIYANTDWLHQGKPAIERERCYGIARAGKNDCGSSMHSCAGQAQKDNQPNEWIMVPKGVCHKIVGGNRG